MHIDLFTDGGYINIPGILKTGLPFIFLVGARGTGKTYGALKEVVENEREFIYMRRTQAQADLVTKPAFSPFKAYNRDTGKHIECAPISKYNSAFYNGVESDKEPGAYVPSGSPLGYTCALSTISNIRGFDASDVDIVLYDEFIPEVHDRPIRGEGKAFLNAYETINRNRELQGRRPVQMLCMANSNLLANPIFIELGLVNKAEKLQREGRQYAIFEKRGIGLFILHDAPISQAKANTALYKLSHDSDFAKMALGNTFTEVDTDTIKPHPLTEFRPLAVVGELAIYQHKNRRLCYCTTHKMGSAPEYKNSEIGKRHFIQDFRFLWGEYVNGHIDFEDYNSEVLFKAIFGY